MTISLKFISSCLAVVCRTSGKRAVLILNDSKSEDQRKLVMLAGEYSQIFEETENQDPV